MIDLWMDLAEAITASERENRDRAEQMWHANDVLTAVRLKGIADGLDMAREHMLRLSADSRCGKKREPTPLEAAMHSVWLHGKWRWITSKMDGEEREAAADAALRYHQFIGDEDDDPALPITGLRWWRDE